MTIAIPLAAIAIALLQLREARLARGASRGANATTARDESGFLCYDVGKLSRDYAKDPLVTVGEPYARLQSWPLRRSSHDEAPLCIRIVPGKFVLQRDRPAGWCEVSDLAYGALQAAGQNVAHSLVSDDLVFLRPVALARELVRGGKPELFFIAGTNCSRADLKERRTTALRLARSMSQPQEIAADGPFASAARFLDLEKDPSVFHGPKMAPQASELLGIAREHADVIREMLV